MSPAQAVAETVKAALAEQDVLEDVEDGGAYGSYEAVLYAVTPDGRPVTITVEVAPDKPQAPI